MAVKRKYRCTDCGFQFDYTHVDKREALLTDCPNVDCVSNRVQHDVEAERAEGEARIARMVESGIPPGVRGNHSRAMDIAQANMESMGFTDVAGTGHAGDIAAPTPKPMHTAEIEQMTRQAVEAKAITQQDAQNFADGARSFWQGPKNASKGDPRPAKLQQYINAAPVAAAHARQMGADPIKMLHDGEKKAGGMKYDVVARARA